MTNQPLTGLTPDLTTAFNQITGGKVSPNPNVGPSRADQIRAIAKGGSANQTSVQNWGDVGKGFIKGAGRTLGDIQDLGKGALGKAGIDTSKMGINALDNIQYKNQDEAVGGGLEGATELGAGFVGDAFKAKTAAEEGLNLAKSKAAEPVVNALTDKVIPAVENKASESKLLLGEKGVKDLAKIKDPEVQAYVPKEQGGMGKQLSDVVKKTQDTITSFTKNSIANFNSVLDKIPKSPVNLGEMTTRVNDAMGRAITNTLDKTLGISPKDLGVESIEDLKGKVTPDELTTIKNVAGTVEKWPNKTARGLVELRRNLQGLYQAGEDASTHAGNKVIKAVNDELKNIIAESIPDTEVKQAYETASKNIDKADEFTSNFLGTDTNKESKLKSLAGSLKNPALKGDQIKLLGELGQQTGYSPLRELKGYSDFLDIGGGKGDLLTKGDIFKTGAKRVGGATTAAGLGGLGLEKLFGQ